MRSRFSLAILMKHPTQMDGPLFANIQRAGLFDLTVFYLATERITSMIDPELGYSPEQAKLARRVKHRR